jgi:5-methylcytosine-specific restriction endonuclease McrA
MRTILDLTGQRFGRLLAVEPRYDAGIRKWLCRCDCGNETLQPAGSLRSKNGKKVSSCGCFGRENLAKIAEIGRIHGSKNRLPPGTSPRNSVLNQYRHQAKARGLVWELTNEEAIKLMAEACHYCGIGPSNIFHAKYRGSGVFVYNGIDRKDNSAGYCVWNVVPCCKQCNFAKKTLGYEEFLQWVRRLTQHCPKEIRILGPGGGIVLPLKDDFLEVEFLGKTMRK